MCMNSDAGSAMRDQQQRQQALTNQSVAQINNAFAGFTPAFYNQRAQDYVNYAMPQEQQQSLGNERAMTANLANRGMLNSFVQDQQKQALQQANTQATQSIGNQGIGLSQGLQQQVGNEQASLINQAQTSSSPSTMGQLATASASGFSGPSAFQPIGDMFGQFSNMYLANQLQQTYQPYLNPYMYGQQQQQGMGGGLGNSANFVG